MYIYINIVQAIDIFIILFITFLLSSLYSSSLLFFCIDFMRKYTWDKQLETWVKSTGIMGGRGKIPTVISPEQYKLRFRDAMWRYFVLVPTAETNIVLGEDVTDQQQGGASNV